jgi:hypothetical protein
MSIKVELSIPKEKTPAKGTAAQKTQMGGTCTTVSALMEAGNATGNASLVKKSIG